MKRTTIEFSEKMSEVIQNLIDSEDAKTVSEVVRNSIGLYHLAKSEVRSGNKIAVIDRNGKIIKEVLLNV